MTKLFLFAPAGLSDEAILQCATAAVAAGGCASIVIPHKPLSELKLNITALQKLGLATLLRDCDATAVLAAGADGLHLTDVAAMTAARSALKNESLGFFADTSRHIAMEAAEAGADYMAFAQTRQTTGEPIIGWWQDLTQIPSVAFDPVDATVLPDVMTQNPDFIRPSDDMWQSPEMAAAVISALMSGLKP